MSVPPAVSLAVIAPNTRRLRRFRSYGTGCHLWNPAYCVGTAGTVGSIKRYIVGFATVGGGGGVRRWEFATVDRDGGARWWGIATAGGAGGVRQWGVG